MTTSLRAIGLGSRLTSSPLSQFTSCTAKPTFSSYTTTTSAQPAARSLSTSSTAKCIFTIPASTRASPTQRNSSSSPLAKPQYRNASSSTVAPTTSSTTSTTSISSPPLTWEQYFKLRKSRRRYSLASSIISAISTTAFAVPILQMQDLDALGAQVMGMDPFLVLGIATAASGAVGWLLGPMFGNAIWGAVNRTFRGSFALKEKEFYARIKRYRVDPSSNSFSNPVPDFYGEKISSVAGYRNWLKDQRAYNRKRNSNFV